MVQPLSYGGLMVSEAIRLGSNATHVLPFCRLKYVHNKVRNEYMISRMAGRVSHLNLVVWPRSPRVPHGSVVRASNRHLEGHGFNSRWKDSEFFLSIRLESIISFFSFLFFPVEQARHTFNTPLLPLH